MWPAYDATTDQDLLMNRVTTSVMQDWKIETGLRKEACDFWDQQFEASKQVAFAQAPEMAHTPLRVKMRGSNQQLSLRTEVRVTASLRGRHKNERGLLSFPSK